jgi:DNA-binding transcriptional LysR family regulator
MPLHSLEELQAFVSVVDAGSLTAAAQRLRLPATTVGRRLATLEERLNRKLIHRSTRSSSVSEAGEVLLPSARAILEEAARAETALEEDVTGLSGTVSISVPTLLCSELLIALKPLVRENPALKTRVLVADRPVNPIVDQVDVAIWGGALTDSALVQRKLMTVEFVLAASAEYVETYGSPETIADFEQRGTAQFASTDRPYVLIDKRGDKHMARPPCVFQATDGRAVIDAIASGLGIGVVSTRALKRDPRLVRVMTAYRLEPLNLSAVFPASMRRTARVTTLVEQLRRSMRAVVDEG